jgi:hypothetical protein
MATAESATDLPEDVQTLLAKQGLADQSGAISYAIELQRPGARISENGWVAVLQRGHYGHDIHPAMAFLASLLTQSQPLVPDRPLGAFVAGLITGSAAISSTSMDVRPGHD